jgi:predicted nucleic acid-binding protein
MVLDTNILIAYLKGEPEVMAALGQWRQEGRGLVVSSISFAEVLALPALSGTEIQVVTRFMRSFLCIPFDERLAEKAARLARLYRLKIPDAAIAATAVDCDMPLVSRDKVFRQVKEVSLAEL